MKKTDNFTAEDLQELGAITNLEIMKQKAFELIDNPNSSRPMQPKKVAWFKTHLEAITSKEKVIKLMWDLLLAGEDMQVLGSKSTMNQNQYRKTFG